MITRVFIITTLYCLLDTGLAANVTHPVQQVEDRCDEKDSTCSLMGKFALSDTRCWVTCKGQQKGAVGKNSYCHVISGPDRGLFKCAEGNWIPLLDSHGDETVLTRVKKGWWRRRRRRNPPPPPPPPNKPPYFTSCPAAIHVQASANQNKARATWSVSAADPNGGSPTVTRNEGPAANSFFNEGSRTVKYTAQDPGGLTATCVFTVTVTVVRCPKQQQLSNFPHGSQSCSGIEKNIYGSVCRHSCDSGYVLQGQATVTCQSSSTWTSSFPSCQPRSCGAPGSVAGGAVTCPQGHVFPNPCLIHCLAGYSNTGVTSITCTAAGHWSSPLPTCLDVEAPTFPHGCPVAQQLNSGPLESPVTLTWADPVTSDNSGKSVTLTSDPAKGSQRGPGSYLVNITASDEAGNEQCCQFLITIKARRCGTLQSPANGEVNCTRSNVEGSQCVTFCNLGYRLRGAATLQCLNTEFWDNSAPTCEAIICPLPLHVTHGSFQCPTGYQHPATCNLTCWQGFEAVAPTQIQCLENATWSGFGYCNDTQPPQFVSGCPDDIYEYASPLGSETSVTWSAPDVTDNSNGAIDLHSDIVVGASFMPGTTPVTYVATDENGNSASCQFFVKVTVLQCKDPNNDPDVSRNEMKDNSYTCSNGYVHGASCTVSCAQNYTLVGANNITCQRDDSTHPPATLWEWEGGHPEMPVCRVDQCPPLPRPKNGALSCHLGAKAKDCTMSCDSAWDLPYNFSGYYYCLSATRAWVPDAIYAELGCVRRRLPHRQRIQASLFYFTNDCKSSVEELRQKFITRMSESFFKDACVGVPSCTAENTQVTCGPVWPSSNRRRKRDTSFNEETKMVEKEEEEEKKEEMLPKRMSAEMESFLQGQARRASWSSHPLSTSSSHAYLVTFEVHMPYVEDDAQSAEQAYRNYLTSQALLHQKLLNEVREGRMDVGGVAMGERGGVGPSFLQVDCPPGTLLHPHHPTLRRFSCVKFP